MIILVIMICGNVNCTLKIEYHSDICIGVLTMLMHLISLFYTKQMGKVFSTLFSSFVEFLIPLLPTITYIIFQTYLKGYLLLIQQFNFNHDYENKQLLSLCE